MARPSLFWPSFWAALGFLLLLGLGTWQVERLHWKEGLIAERQAALHAAPVALPSSLAAARTLEFHPVKAEGEFLNAHELHLNAQSLRGAAGFHIITPFRLADGAVLLVDRGFVPTDRAAPATRPAGELQGRVAVTGLLRLPEAKGWFTPDNEPQRNSWFSIDLPAMGKAAGFAQVLPFYVDADATPNPGGWPEGGQTITDLPNHHLQYAITWYALALALVVIYIRFARRRLGERS
ncbi:MAG TPA: SURF1 family protein [Stellaceae bacterium]|nr:SURF1 family protein [Stellaceae bacterium]